LVGVASAVLIHDTIPVEKHPESHVGCRGTLMLQVKIEEAFLLFDSGFINDIRPSVLQGFVDKIGGYRPKTVPLDLLLYLLWQVVLKKGENKLRTTKLSDEKIVMRVFLFFSHFGFFVKLLNTTRRNSSQLSIYHKDKLSGSPPR
jgi:hypothetical protein